MEKGFNALTLPAAHNDTAGQPQITSFDIETNSASTYSKAAVVIYQTSLKLVSPDPYTNVHV